MTSNDRDQGYIYIKHWKRFQHPDVVRGGGRLPWIRDYTDQLNNQDYLDLPLSIRAGLQDIRRLVAECGQGRCSARADYLQRRCSWPAGHAQKILKRLIQDGFIEVRASKAQAPRKRLAGRDREGSNEPKKENARERPAAKTAAAARLEEPIPPEPAPNGFKGAEAARADFLRRTAEKQAMP